MEISDNILEEIDKLIKWCDMKSSEYMDNGRKDKITDYIELKRDLKDIKKKYKGSDKNYNVKEELFKLEEYFGLTQEEVEKNGEVPLRKKASKASLSTEIRKRIRESEGEMMDVSVKTRTKWREKYGSDK